MRPMFFGAPDRRLFGVYHAPQREPVSPAGVLICQSIGHEYVRAHRALRNLAAMFARRGFPVLRFDYFGCGDSAGDSRELTLEQSVADATAAAMELTRLSGARRVSFVGHRFGSAVALLASANRSDDGATILWDPIVRGSVYLQSLADLHSAWMRSGGRSAAEELASYPDAVLGFTVSPALRTELMALDLRTTVAARRVTAALHLVVTDQPADTHPMAACVKDKYGDPAVRYVGEPAGWDEPGLIHTALAAPQALQSIAAWLPSSDTVHRFPVGSPALKVTSHEYLR